MYRQNRHLGETELHTTGMADADRRRYDSKAAEIASTTLVADVEPEQASVTLVSLDGTPGDALQLHGTYLGTILASVDRRRLVVDDAVRVLRNMYGPTTEIAGGVMPSAVTR